MLLVAGVVFYGSLVGALLVLELDELKLLPLFELCWVLLILVEVYFSDGLILLTLSLMTVRFLFLWVL